MISLSRGLRIRVATQPGALRRGVDGRQAVVAAALAADPYCGDVFVFRAKRRDRLRCIYWDGSGMILSTKWLESGKFVFPRVKDGAICMSPEEFNLLVAGLDWTRVQQKAVKRPAKAA